jgi:hypothetical protein
MPSRPLCIPTPISPIDFNHTFGLLLSALMVSMDNLHLSDARAHCLNCKAAIQTCQPLGGDHMCVRRYGLVWLPAWGGGGTRPGLMASSRPS